MEERPYQDDDKGRQVHVLCGPCYRIAPNVNCPIGVIGFRHCRSSRQDENNGHNHVTDCGKGVTVESVRSCTQGEGEQEENRGANPKVVMGGFKVGLTGVFFGRVTDHKSAHSEYEADYHKEPVPQCLLVGFESIIRERGRVVAKDSLRDQEHQ